MSLLMNMLSTLVITFLPRSKHLLISWLQSPSAVILETKRIKSFTVSIVSPPICHEVMGPDAMISVFWILSFKPSFPLSSFTFKRLFSSLSAIRMVSSAYLRLLIFLLAIFILACAHHFMGNRWGNNGNSERLYFLGLQNHCGRWLSHEIKRRLLLGRKAMTNLDSVFKSRDITLSTNSI